MEIEYLKCHHGAELRFGCLKCDKEKSDLFYYASSVTKKDNRSPILRGCLNISNGSGGQCFCTGKCRDVIGYLK